MNIITCRELADTAQKKTLQQCQLIAAKTNGHQPRMAFMYYDESTSDQNSASHMQNAIMRSGIAVQQFRITAGTVYQSDIENRVETICANPAFDAVYFKPSIPAPFDAHAILNRISPEKDAAAITDIVSGFAAKHQKHVPDDMIENITATTRVLLYTNQFILRKTAAIVWKSESRRMHLAIHLKAMGFTVTMCSPTDEDVKKICKNADLVILADSHMDPFDETYFRGAQTIIDCCNNHNRTNRKCDSLDCFKTSLLQSNLIRLNTGTQYIKRATLCAQTVILTAQKFNIQLQ